MSNTQSRMEDIALTRKKPHENKAMEHEAKEMECKMDDVQPLISFIVPCYNTPVEWLMECLDSIIALSLADDEREIIIVDDGSETSLEKELTDYQDAIRYVRQNNGGPGSARNTGLQHARGRYVQFVDSDDRLNSAEYDKCVSIVKDSNTDMLLFDFQDGSGRKHITPTESVNTGCNYMIDNNIMGMPWWYVFKRSILNGLRFTTNIYHEDEEFNPLLIVNAKTLLATSIKAYVYCKRPDSITTTKDASKTMKRFDDKHGVIRRLKKAGESAPPLASEALQRRVAQLTMDYLYDIIVDTRSSEQLSMRIKELSNEDLFPLPDCPFTQTYAWFRRIINCRIGRWLMLNTLPRIADRRR